MIKHYYNIQIIQPTCTRHKLLNWNVACRPCSVSVLVDLGTGHPSASTLFPSFCLARPKLLHLLLAYVCQVPGFGSSICMHMLSLDFSNLLHAAHCCRTVDFQYNGGHMNIDPQPILMLLIVISVLYINN